MVFFVGSPSQSINRLALELAQSGTPCAATSWLDLPESQAHVCVLVSAPESHAERAVLAALARRRVPLFRLAEDPAFDLYGRHTVCRLPCEMETEALSHFLSWCSPGKNPAPGDHAADNGRLAERNRQLVHELRLASELQRSILPRGVPAGVAVNLARKYVPYQYIGGDFYDFVPLANGALGLVIADACGHGIAAAFLTAMFKSAFGLFAQAGESPARTLSRMNTEFTRTLMADHFMSAFYGVLDPMSGLLTYCSAGHPPQILFRAGGDVEELTSIGFLLGSIEKADYQDGALTMHQGDRLLLYTDGLVEATDAGGVQFGRERIVQCVRRRFSSSIEDISSELLSEAVMYQDQPTFQDDVTLILAELAEEL